MFAAAPNFYDYKLKKSSNKGAKVTKLNTAGL